MYSQHIWASPSMQNRRFVTVITGSSPNNHTLWSSFITQPCRQIPDDNETLSVFTIGRLKKVLRNAGYLPPVANFYTISLR